MRKTKKIFFTVLFFVTTVLHAQTPSGYVLSRTNLSSQSSNHGTVTYQWVASNNTTQSGNFYILEKVPGQFEVLSITRSGTPAPSSLFDPSLPLLGPETLTIGPFLIASNSSVTFQVTEIVPDNAGQANPGETFTLLSQTQLAQKNPKSLITSLSVNRGGTPIPYATTSLSGNLIQSAVAAPNISRENQPIDFLLNLASPALVRFSLYSVAGELVFDSQAQEGQGASSLVWNSQNNAHQNVASGLYIYLFKADGAGTEETRIGKVLIIH